MAYERGQGDFVILEQEELDSVALESSTHPKLHQFTSERRSRYKDGRILIDAVIRAILDAG
jgi:hypothetical protein